MRGQLKMRTAMAHARVDNAMSGLSLCQRDTYITFLRTHHLAYRVLRQVMPPDHWIAEVLTKVLKNLDKDLALLHVTRAARPMIGVSEPMHPLGVAYVICGSHFGKRVLQRRWQRTNDATVAAAGAYLGDDVLATGWARLLGELEALDDPANDLNDMALSADRTFSLFYDCLQSVKHWERADAAA